LTQGSPQKQNITRKKIEYSIIGILKYWCNKLVISRHRSQVHNSAPAESDNTVGMN
jgi:hypothetical protein